MKKAFIIPILAIVVLGIISIFKKDVPLPAPATPITACFERSVTATRDAPYTVHESVTLVIDGSRVTGTKSGTQAGPDMTNGYTGTLSGEKSGDDIVARFAYTIEGSSQVEEERYRLEAGALIKQRYPLVEAEGILVPDLGATPTEQRYESIPCGANE